MFHQVVFFILQERDLTTGMTIKPWMEGGEWMRDAGWRGGRTDVGQRQLQVVKLPPDRFSHAHQLKKACPQTPTSTEVEQYERLTVYRQTGLR